jgi:hypothetical protein
MRNVLPFYQIERVLTLLETYGCEGKYRVSLDICGHSMSVVPSNENRRKPLQGKGYSNIGRKRSEHNGRHCPIVSSHMPVYYRNLLARKYLSLTQTKHGIFSI